MDQEVIQVIADFLSKFYIWEAIIIVVAIALTGLLKLPIKKQALKLQEKYGVDKSMLTWVTALIPYSLCFIMVFVLYWYKSGFTGQLELLDYQAIVSEGIILGSGSIGLYEAVKKVIKGGKAIKEKKEQQEEAKKNKPQKKYR